MTVVVQCKRCGKELRAKDRYAGMPTRCPRCKTINQLPSLPDTGPPKKAVPKPQPTHNPKSSPQKPTSDTCKICGKPIRGKVERFTDVHGTVYHLGCYQKQAGDVPEDACRICRKPFKDTTQRVKDVVGFYYHRNCYHEELERQRLAAGGAKPMKPTGSPAKQPAKPKPKPKPVPAADDWNLTPDDGEQIGTLDDDWMRPDLEELELKEEQPKPAAPRKSAPKPARAKPPAARPAPPRPETPKPKLVKPPATSTSDKASSTPKTASPAKISAESKTAQPTPTPRAPRTKKPPLKKAKPLRRAKPIEERPKPQPALPEGLELLPDNPNDLPEGLELIPDKPGELPEGLELLPESPQVPVAEIVEGVEILDDASSAAPMGLTPLDPLGGLDPYAGSPQGGLSGGASPGDPFQHAPLDSAAGLPASVTPRRRSADNSIPKWLWAAMGVAVGLLVIMLLASIVSAVLDSNTNQQQVATPETSRPDETRPSDNSSFSNEVRLPQNDGQKPPQAGPAPNSRIATYRRLTNRLKNVDTAHRIAGLAGIAILFAVFALSSALAMRLACKIGAKSDVSGAQVLTLFLAHGAAMILLCVATATLEFHTAKVIELTLAAVVVAASGRFVLSTSTGRAIAIAVCHLFMWVAFTFVGVFLLFCVVSPIISMLIAAMR